MIYAAGQRGVFNPVRRNLTFGLEYNFIHLSGDVSAARMSCNIHQSWLA
jgi:hypothetical protein